MLGRAVDAHGAGYVVRNIVAHIMTRGLVRNHQLPRIIMALVVGMRWGSRKKIIALGDIIHIVGKGGRPGIWATFGRSGRLKASSNRR